MKIDKISIGVGIFLILIGVSFANQEYIHLSVGINVFSIFWGWAVTIFGIIGLLSGIKLDKNEVLK